MADNSSFMDWHPQTPPAPFNPYQGDYMPGGWPEERPTPPPALPPFPTRAIVEPARRRGPLEEYIMPAAKRVCTGLFGASVATFTFTTAAVAVPAYAIVREVRRRQHIRTAAAAARARQAARRLTFQTPPPRTPPHHQQNDHADTPNLFKPDTPHEHFRQATVTDTEDIQLASTAQQYTTNTLPDHSPLESTVQQETITVRPQPKQYDGVPKDFPYEVPEFRPAYLRNPKRLSSLRSRRLNTFPGMVRLLPRPSLNPIIHKQTEPGVQQPLPDARNVQIHSPIPQLLLQALTPPSAVALTITDGTLTPSNQLLGDLLAATPGTPILKEDILLTTPASQLHATIQAATESDPDGATVISSTSTSRKRRFDKQGSRDSEDVDKSTGKRLQLRNPRFESPKTPTPNPSIIVRAVVATKKNADSPSTPVNKSLLSPSYFQRRHITARSAEKTPLRDVQNVSETPLSFLSSNCDASPGNYHIDGLKVARSPVKSEISSFFAGSPPAEALRSPVKSEISSFFEGSPAADTELNAQVFTMITAGGGSPTPKSKHSIKSEDMKETTGPNSGDEQAQSSGLGSSGNNTVVDGTKDEASDGVTSTPEMTSDEPLGLANQEGLSDSNNITAETEPASKNVQTEVKKSSTTSTPQHITAVTSSSSSSSVDLTDDDKTGESSSAPTTTSTPSAPHTPEKQLAQLSLEEDKYNTPTPKAILHSAEKTTRKTRAISRREHFVSEQAHYNLVELNAEWKEKVQTALRKGHGDYAASDFTRVVPLNSNSYGTSNWLNDEVINGYLKLVVKHGNQNDRPTQVPTFHAFASFFFTNLESKGHDGVRRWATRAKIGGKSLLETTAVFIPINSGAHWTLAVVSGKHRSATHYNSLPGSVGRRAIAAIKTWLAGELGAAFREEEWTFVEGGESPQQNNSDDCGVFAVTSARQIMLGQSPLSYSAAGIPRQRERIVAELVAGGLLRSGV